MFILVDENTKEPFKTSYKVHVKGALVDSFVITDEKKNLQNICEKLKKRNINCEIAAVHNITEYFQNAIVKHNPLGICFVKYVNRRYCFEDLFKKFFFPKNTEVSSLISILNEKRCEHALSENSLYETIIKDEIFFAQIDKKNTNTNKAELKYELSEDGKTASILVYADVSVEGRNSYCLLTVKDAYNYIKEKAPNKTVSVIASTGEAYELNDDFFIEDLTALLSATGEWIAEQKKKNELSCSKGE